MDCINCKLEKRMDAAEKDIDKLQRGQGAQDVNAGKTEVTLQYIKITLDDVKKKIDKITETPRKRWDLVVNTSIAGVVAAIVAAAMAVIIIK